MVEALLAFVLIALITAIAVPSVQAVLSDNADNATLAELAELAGDVEANVASQGRYAGSYHRADVVELAPGGLAANPTGSTGPLTVIDGLDEQSTGNGWVSVGLDSEDVEIALAMRTSRGRCAYVVSAAGAIVSAYATDDATCRADRARLGNGDGALAGTDEATAPGE